jgi:hypothetical protein
METSETTIVVAAEGKATLQLSADVAPGPHRVAVTIDEAHAPAQPFRAEDLPHHDIPWPFAPGESFRREDLHGDDERGKGGHSKGIHSESFLRSVPRPRTRSRKFTTLFLYSHIRELEIAEAGLTRLQRTGSGPMLSRNRC